MSDQQIPAAETQPTADNPTGAGTTQDTTAVETGGPPSGYVPESQYNELRGWSTREAQWRAQHEPHVSLLTAAQSGDQEAIAQLLGQLGYELDDPAAATEQQQEQYQNDPALLARLEALEQRNSQADTSAQQQAQYATYRSTVDPDIAQLGVPEGIRDAVADYALNNLPGVPCPPSAKYPNGVMPDLEGAKKAIEDFLVAGASMPSVQTAVKKAWQQTKPSAAMTQPGGVQATHTPALDTRAAKADYISRLLSQGDAEDQALV